MTTNLINDEIRANDDGDESELFNKKPTRKQEANIEIVVILSKNSIVLIYSDLLD